MVVADEQNWGGWRTPGAEYDRDPIKMERQARLIAKAPALQAIARELIRIIDDMPQDAPPEIQALALRAAAIERYVQEMPQAAKAAAPEPSPAFTETPEQDRSRLSTARYLDPAAEAAANH